MAIAVRRQGAVLDVNGNLIGRWKQELEGNAAGVFPGKGKRTAEQPAYS